MKKLLLGFIILIIIMDYPFTVRADSLDDTINDLIKKIDTAQSQERTLNNEIIKIDNQIRLTELNIQKKENDITKLGEEIAELSTKIEKLEINLSHLLILFSNRVVNSYKTIKTSYLTLLFSSGSLSELLSRSKYIQMAQVNDQQVMTEVQRTKVEYKDQKDKREEKKIIQENLKKQLQVQKTKLDTDKKTKNTLLIQTKNDEETYQRLLQQALAEKQALDAALISGVSEGQVKKGDPIALMGNTGYPGCSTGTHLHFEIHKDNQWVDPGNYLKSKTLEDQQDSSTATIGSGDWDWPLEGDVILTQHYGRTPYSWRYAYSGGIHTGLDLYTKGSAVIRAPKDGVLYSSSQNCGGSSVIKIKYIEHGDGLISFYLHVQ